jgi:hypothetical protein
MEYQTPMTDPTLDTPTDRRATFALLTSLRAAASAEGVRGELERVERLAQDVLEQGVSAQDLLAEELGLAD